MKELKFKCTLLSDVILNRKSDTTGPNETLDFIPGGNFLGIAASRLYPSLTPAEASVLFHSGKVRFGDAHPSLEGFRALRVPASMYYPKLTGPESELFIHHRLPADRDLSDRQLKQCRSGFYDFSCSGDSPAARRIATETAFAVKSAYDPEKRRSKDEQLFGYQSLRKGLTMYFSVEIDDSVSIDGIESLIIDALCGERQVGRSRSAQYGLVRIEPTDYAEAAVETPVKHGGRKSVAVYADSRLVFLDEYGFPTFRPTAEMLGLKGEVNREKSQVRTFRYAPWNFKRQSFDTDRCGIEKGSVLVVDLPEGYEPDLRARYVGYYKNEGFGHIIYNPAFLAADEDGNARFTLAPSADIKPQSHVAPLDINATPLLRYLGHMREMEKESETIYRMVNRWTAKNAKEYIKGDFASQWGNIRNLALGALDINDLRRELFAETPEATGYLVHGIAKDKWAGKRLRLMKDFIEEAEHTLDPSMARMAVVNLASEMGKKIRQKS